VAKASALSLFNEIGRHLLIGILDNLRKRIYHYYMINCSHDREGGTMADITAERCECSVIHADVVKRVEAEMPPAEELYELAEVFKVFGDTTRIRILWALFEAEMCVCDIACLLGMSQSSISHQLRLLKQSRLVKFRRDGKTVYYSLDDEHVKMIFDQGMIHVNEKSR
jgi:ArsR family transcriptional regulator, lead/cadmium/zinc/bismuth-responsive transcriptional repressor